MHFHINLLHTYISQEDIPWGFSTEILHKFSTYTIRCTGSVDLNFIDLNVLLK
jgi:hypothetical protein